MDRLYDTIFNKITDLDPKMILSQETCNELATSLSNFVEAAIVKYIKGQQEHGGNIQDRDLDKEIDQEIIDIFHYHQARKIKESPHS